MRTAIAAVLVASLITTALAAAAAQASPTQVNVRIEGKTETLFEGPILTDGHNVRASSDAKAPKAGRRCNGLNNGQNPTPGPTPTAASVDAMSILGEGFDGLWYAEPFEDYFIKRWGSDGQNEAKGEYWGVVVNNVFTNVGGCQYQLDGGDEVLWVYDAFKGRSRLALYPAGYSGGSQPLTAAAELGRPFELEVDAWGAFNEGEPPDSPERAGSNPFEGAEVAPVKTNAKGFERVDTGDPHTVTTDAAGRASITFEQPGWHRIKATVTDPGGEESVVRSNRLDVCVPEPPAGGCGALPPEDQVRTPPPVKDESEPEPEGPKTEKPPAGGGLGAQGSEGDSPPAETGQVRLQLPQLDRSRLAQGLVKVRWQVLDAGVGVKKWTISSRALGRRGVRYVTRAAGTSETSATLRLPAGVTYRLRLTVTDHLDRSSSATIGTIKVPSPAARRGG